MLRRLIVYSLIILSVRVYQLYIPVSSFQHTYILSIDCPTLGNGLVKNYIDQFNNLGQDKDIKFNKDSRPITIHEFTPTKDQEYLLGYTYVKKKDAEVYLKNTLEWNQIKPVLTHELLHAYGFDHVKQSDDLMSQYLSQEVNYEPQYIVYYRKLHKVIYGK